MNLDSYDKLIWRFNGTLLMVGCVIGFIMILVAGFNLFIRTTQIQPLNDLSNSKLNVSSDDYFWLGLLESLKGTDFNLIPLSAETNSGILNYNSLDIRINANNYLLFNKKTKENFWIFKSQQINIFKVINIFDHLNDDKNQKVVSLVFETGLKLKDKSKKNSNENELRSVVFFDLQSKKSLTIIDNVTRIVGIQQTFENEILIFYSKDGKSYFRDFSNLTLIPGPEVEISNS